MTSVPLPDAIPVRYTEEEAGYVSFRPVVRQTFRPHELLDMVLSVTGKEPARIQKILRSGTVVFHFYRYWWDGFESSDEELQAVLAQFPDADPLRPFRAETCTKALLEGSDPPRNFSVELDRAVVSRKRLLRRHSFWDALLAAAAAGPLRYAGYSYGHRGDLYRLELTSEARAKLSAAVVSQAPRDLRKELQAVRKAEHVVFICPREAAR